MLSIVIGLGIAAANPSSAADIRADLDAALRTTHTTTTATNATSTSTTTAPTTSPTTTASATTAASSFPWVAGVGALALGGAAVFAARRKKALGGGLRIVESANLGKSRSVAVI